MLFDSEALTTAAGRLGAAAQNALEVARYGGLETDDEPSPYEVVATTGTYRLRRYFPERSEREPGRPAALLVPPLMVSTEVYDVAEASSAVRALDLSGIEPWVVDFGAPEREEGGLQRSLTDHVLAVSDAVSRVCDSVDGEVHLLGYSQGGMFCYQAAALRRSEGIASIVTFGSPVDTRGLVPLGIPEDAAARVVGAFLRGGPFRQGVPSWATRTGFLLLDPVKSLRSRVDFVRRLHDREALAPREAQRRFLANQGWVAYPGPAIAELMEQFVAHNRMISGGFVIDDRLVTLADIDCPVLCFVGEIDEIAQGRSVRSVGQAAPNAEIYEYPIRTGHFGLVVGSMAARESWPTSAAWIRWHEGAGPRPEGIAPLDAAGAEDDEAQGTTERLVHAAELTAEMGVEAARSGLETVLVGGAALRRAVAEALDQIPRVNRLASIGGRTRISLGKLLSEAAEHSPNATFFLYEGRGHTYGDAQRRIDNIVRGLIHVGVRQGDHVGVLMGTRPSAVAVVAALSRLGAVVVLMRPDGSPQAEAELGEVVRIIADPENGALAGTLADVPVMILGGGGESRELGFGLTDMERIDPDRVELPEWYRPDEALGRDLAFILFAGDGDHIRVNRITNRRWALSAFGTATASALSPSDTVYVVTPIHHPSALLTGIGGAVAGGSRIALTPSFDPSTFWDEVRRYGITVVSYTWTLLAALLDAPATSNERHHPIRLFIGSGMPSGLWRRVLERFAPAGVVEFYVSTAGEAILVNLGGTKVGSKGRPLPGSAEVRVAAYDGASDRPAIGPDGFARRCAPDEVGVLMVEARHDRGGLLGPVLRGVFERGDAWISSGDLFRVDADGAHWMVDNLRDLIHTARRSVPSQPISERLERIDPVDLAVTYGVGGPGAQRIFSAVTLRPGSELTGTDLVNVFEVAGPDWEGRRPDVVRVVDEIPLTTWYRPLKAELREAGLPADDTTAWVWRPRTGIYTRVDASARRRLAP